MTGQVSELLVRWSGGDREALNQLMPIVYGELRTLGRRYLASRRGEVVLQPTVLIHEAWMRLASKQGLEVHDRLQFFALSAKIIRDILADHFRRERAQKRGGDQILVSLDSAGAAATPDAGVDFLVLNEAIEELARIKARYARIIELRFIAGLTVQETADVIGVSDATVEREWTFARLWLRRALKKSDPV